MTGTDPSNAADEADAIELGMRAAASLRVENRGLARQRTACLTTRPLPLGVWKLDYTDGKVTSMTWAIRRWQVGA